MNTKLSRKVHLPLLLTLVIAALELTPSYRLYAAPAKAPQTPKDFNVVLVSDVSVTGTANHSSFTPSDRIVVTKVAESTISLSQVSDQGLLRIIKLVVPAPPQVGRQYPVFSTPSASNAQLLYEEGNGSQLSVWNSIGGKVVIDSVKGTTYQFHVINARMDKWAGSPPGMKEDKLTLNFAGTATLQK